MLAQILGKDFLACVTMVMDEEEGLMVNVAAKGEYGTGVQPIIVRVLGCPLNIQLAFTAWEAERLSTHLTEMVAVWRKSKTNKTT